MKSYLRTFCICVIFCSVFLQSSIIPPHIQSPNSNSIPDIRPNLKHILASIQRDLVPISVEPINCPAWGRCNDKPKMGFNVQHAPENVAQFSVHVQIAGAEYIFNNDSVVVEMPLTEKDGVLIMYWASSPLGSVTDQYSFYMRNLITDGVGGKYQFELLGTQWEDQAPGCAVVWNIFPDVATENTGWAERIDDPQKLFTSINYALLAGRLIWTGRVDASSCEYKGLQKNGAATACGEKLASDQVIAWQNEHNALIQSAGLQAHIPARLLKGLIAQESQFWPKWNRPHEAGLGMLTELGVDMLLMWNSKYYSQICNPIYGEGNCMYGYSHMLLTSQQFLRDMAQLAIGTDKEYRLLAETLYASCAQAGQLVNNVTLQEPRDVASYEEMWRITFGIYHSGCGCLYDAMNGAWNSDKTLKWSNINLKLEGVCQSAGDYFDRIVRFGATTG